jgi:hypothetical protein
MSQIPDRAIQCESVAGVIGSLREPSNGTFKIVGDRGAYRDQRRPSSIGIEQRIGRGVFQGARDDEVPRHVARDRFQHGGLTHRDLPEAK